MNIFIAGGGRVGFHLARLLSKERQDVTVIESDRDQLEQIDYALDVSTVRGDGSSVMLLQSLGVGAAEIFVACMGNDEMNLIAAATAKGLGAKQVVARVGNTMYLDSNILYETIFSIDYILSPDALAALEIANYIEHPGIIISEEFGKGLVQMRQVRVENTPTTNGKTLKDIVPPGSGVLLGVIMRNGKTIIPHGDSVVEVGDHVGLVGEKKGLEKMQRLFMHEDIKSKRVFIMGGGTIGLQIARALDGKIKTVKLFERREDRCEALAQLLRKAKVICRDAATRSSLEQEHIDAVDVFVASTSDDERNIMAAVLAKELGAKRVVAVINQPDFAPLVRRLGIDLAITPRASIANRILRLAHQGEMTTLTVLDEGAVEVMELAIDESSPVIGQPLKTVSSRFPRGALIGTIIRGEKVFVPGGDDEILAGDSVVLIASDEAIGPALKVLKKK